MAPKGIKRPAVADSGAVKKQCTAVVKALSEADLPYPVVKTLELAAPFALTTYADERHPHQVSLIGMIEEALKGIQDSLQKSVDECQTLVSGKDAEKTKREAAVLAAGKELMGSKIAAANKEYEVYEATQQHSKAAAALKDVKKDQKAGDKTYDKIAATKEGFETLKTKILALKDSKCSSKDCHTLEADLKPYGVDTSLVDSLHLVLQKDPAERSEFDGTIMSKLDAELEATAADLASKLAVEEPGKKTREDATTAAQATADAAKAKLTKLEEEMDAANTTVTDCGSAVSAAEQSLKTYPTDMVEADSKLSDAQEKLASFMATFGEFTALKDRTTPPPPPPEPEAPAAAE